MGREVCDAKGRLHAADTLPPKPRILVNKLEIPIQLLMKDVRLLANHSPRDVSNDIVAFVGCRFQFTESGTS
jgi:hypothetical protein